MGVESLDIESQPLKKKQVFVQIQNELAQSFDLGSALGGISGFLGFVLIISIIGSIVHLQALSSNWKPQKPKFILESLNVSEFSVQSPYYSGKWAAKLKIGNPNKDVKVLFTYCTSRLFFHNYKYELASSDSYGLELGPKTSTEVQIEMGRSNKGEAMVWETSVLDKMGKERSHGKVKFSLSMYLNTNFITNVWYLGWVEGHLSIYCDDIFVPFEGSASTGGASIVKNKECRVDWSRTF